MSATAAFVVALASFGGASRQAESLAAWRVRLESPSAAAREIACAEMRRKLVAADLDAVLVALEQWPPTPALHLRGLVIDLPLLRAPLLERSLRDPEPAAALARMLLVEAFRARADAQAPFLGELDTARGARLPWAQHGLWVERTGAPRAQIGWSALRRTLSDAHAWSQPIVLMPGASDGPEDVTTELAIVAPLVGRAPAEGWLEIEFARRALVPVRRAVATWIVPPALAPKEQELASVRRGGELALLLEGETRLLAEALRRLAPMAPFAQGRLGGDLLAQLGLPCVPLAKRDDDFARGIAAALAVHRMGDGAAVTKGDGASGTPDAPDVDGVTDPRASLRDSIERIERATIGEEVGRNELRDTVDRLANRLANDPLLGGELTELLRAHAAPLAPGAPARVLFEQAARELWLLGRSSRPGTALVDLPPGLPAR